MSFLEKLKLDLGAEERGTTSTSPAKKRGKPKKETDQVIPEKLPPARKKIASLAPEVEVELTLDVYETEKELIIRSPVAGVKTDALEISLEGDMLVIKGRRDKPGDADGASIIQECWWGPFSRRIILPSEVDGNKINAVLEHGVLTIRLPKIEKKYQKRVSVEQMGEE